MSQPLSLRFTPRSFHFHKPARTSRGALEKRAVWVVELAGGSAAPGAGECGPIPGLSADDLPHYAARLELAASAFNALRLETAETALEAAHRLFAPLPSARFGVECAVRDWAAGGRGLLWESPFTCAGAPLPTHGLLWMDSPEGILAQAEAKVGAGFTVLKLKVGALDRTAEVGLLRHLAAAWPHVSLRLDANGAFAPAEALRFLDEIASLPVEFLEQPIAAGDPRTLRAVCARSPIPIALDEELIGVATPDARRDLLDALRPQHVILKPALLGGFAACDDWIAACAETGAQWWANSLLETAIGHSAICQWVAARAPGRTHGLGAGSLFRDNLPSPIRLEGNALVCAPLCAAS